MQLVLCDICRKNTNQTTPVGTMTTVYTGAEWKSNRKIQSQTFSNTIEDTASQNENVVKAHICLPCFGNKSNPQFAFPQLSAAQKIEAEISYLTTTLGYSIEEATKIVETKLSPKSTS